MEDRLGEDLHIGSIPVTGSLGSLAPTLLNAVTTNLYELQDATGTSILRTYQFSFLTSTERLAPTLSSLFWFTAVTATV